MVGEEQDKSSGRGKKVNSIKISIYSLGLFFCSLHLKFLVTILLEVRMGEFLESDFVLLPVYTERRDLLLDRFPSVILHVKWIFFFFELVEFPIGEAAAAYFADEVVNRLLYPDGQVEEDVEERIDGAVQESQAVKDVRHYPMLLLRVCSYQFHRVESPVRYAEEEKNHHQGNYYLERSYFPFDVNTFLVKLNVNSWRGRSYFAYLFG